MLVGGVFPYPDPRRRLYARRAARGLITCRSWPGDGATPFDVVQLVMLRLLWLQRETHRAARGRHREAVNLLARASVETCIAGLYWLHSGDEVARMAGHNAKSLSRVLFYLADEDVLTAKVVDEVASTIAPSADLPTVRRMAEVVDTATGQSIAGDLYHRLYVPLSTLVPHATGWALLRHVKDDQIRQVPKRVWTTRAALHTVDGCMATLAVAMAKHLERSEARLSDYAGAHMSRTVTPLAAIGLRGLIGRWQWSRLPQACRSLMALRRYFATGAASADTYAVRKFRAQRALAEIFQVVDSRMPEEQRRVILEHFADVLAKPMDPPST